VEKGLDVAGTTGGRAKALVREYPDVSVTDKLDIKLVPSEGATALEALPVLCAVEVTRVSEPNGDR